MGVDLNSLSPQQAENLRAIWRESIQKKLSKFYGQRLTPEFTREIQASVAETLASLEIIENQLIEHEG